MWDPALKCPLKCTVGVYRFAVIGPSRLCLHNFIQLFSFAFFFFNKKLESGNPQLGSHCEYNEAAILALVPSVPCTELLGSSCCWGLHMAPFTARRCRLVLGPRIGCTQCMCSCTRARFQACFFPQREIGSKQSKGWGRERVRL